MANNDVTQIVNVKKMNFIKKDMILGGPAENPPSPTDITKFIILFHLQWLGAELHKPVLRISEK